MGQDSRAQAVLGSLTRASAVASLVLLVFACPDAASADPVVRFPQHGKAVLAQCAEGPGLLAMTGEVIGIGVLGAERRTEFPEYGQIRGNEPELGLTRIGLVGRHPCRPLAFALRADFSEAARIESGQLSDRPLAVIDRLVDDAALWWTPRVWASVVAGRQKVPFSRFRQLERTLLTASAVPFLVDRVAPDRRWGATLLGDLGALGYAAGAYADTDRLELRDTVGDPSALGRALLAMHVEWTPRAPIGRDHVATPSADPWYGVARVSAGLGVLWRVRQPGAGSRLDLALNGQLKYQRYAVLVELLAAVDAEEAALGGATEASVLLTNKGILFTRGDYDASADLWSLGGGASYFASADRRSTVSLFAWARRDNEPGGVRMDGVIAQLQASL